MNSHTAAVETDKQENPFSLSECLQSHKPVSNWDQWKLLPFILFFLSFCLLVWLSLGQIFCVMLSVNRRPGATASLSLHISGVLVFYLSTSLPCEQLSATLWF